MQEPVVPRGDYVSIGQDQDIHYHVRGEAERGTVVFLHGSGQGASGWSNFQGNFPAFAEGGWRALVPDALGFGYSTKPPATECTFEALVDGFRRFLDAMGVERCALVGNSLGGAMCVQFALSCPERVERLILMAPGGLERREVYMEMKGIRTMIRAAYSPDGLSRESLRKVFQRQLHDPALITDQIIEERYSIAELQPAGIFGHLKVPYLSDRLGELGCPVLGFWGVNDQFCPVSGAQTLVTRIPRCRVVTINRCGHWVMVEHQEVFNRTSLDFLAEG